MTKLVLPPSIKALLRAQAGRKPRDAAILDLAALNGFRASEIVAVDRDHVDLRLLQIQRFRRGNAQWQPLLISDAEGWQALLAAASTAASPVLVSTRGNRLSRVDVWRVLRAMGNSSGKQPCPITTRHLRAVLGAALAEQHHLPAATAAAMLGVAHFNSVQRFYSRPDWSRFPPGEQTNQS